MTHGAGCPWEQELGASWDMLQQPQDTSRLMSAIRLEAIIIGLEAMAHERSNDQLGLEEDLISSSA